MKLFSISNIHENPTKHRELHFLEVNNHKISEFILKKIIPAVSSHPFPLSELQMMVAVLCWVEPEIVFDWGTNTGKSARIFYETIKFFNLKTRVISIDLPDNHPHVEHPGKSRGVYVKKYKEVKLLQGDGVTTAMQVCKEKKIKSAMFFLDGDHKYKSVKRELDIINKIIKKPTILVHDTFFQSKESNYNIGPHKAVKEFIKKNKKYSTSETKLGLPGMTCIYMETK